QLPSSRPATCEWPCWSAVSAGTCNCARSRKVEPARGAVGKGRPFPTASPHIGASSLAKISLHLATHSLQMKTPFGPAIKRRTSALSFAQNEQRYGLLALISLL